MSSAQIKLRRDTAANWTSANPILADGEFGYEKDTAKAKIGNGVANWVSLAYLSDAQLSDHLAASDPHPQYMTLAESDAAYTPIAHNTNTSNPHSVTKAQVGLGSVDNTSDADKPVSTAQVTAIGLKLDATHAGTGGAAHANVVAAGAAGFMTGADKTKLDGIEASANNYTHPANHAPSIITQDSSNRFVTDAEKTTWSGKQAALGFTPENSANKGAVNGYAGLDAGGKIPAGQLPSYVDDVLEYANLAAFPATGATGIIYVAIDTNKTYRWSGSAYVYITSGAVDSVNGLTGVVTLGTMSSQDATAVNIDGGTIDGTVIGGTTPAAGSFTSLSASGKVVSSGLLYSSGALAAFENAPGIYNYYSGGGVVAAYSDNAGTLAGLILQGSTVYCKAGNTTIGEFSSSGLSVTGALSATGNATLGAIDARWADYSVSNGSWTIHTGTAGGWAQGYTIASNDGAVSLAHFGAYGGTSSTSDYVYIAALGQSYANPTVKVDTAGLSVTGSLSASGAIVSTTGGIRSGNGVIETGFSYSDKGIVGTYSNHSLGLMVNNSEKATLDASGNLGLGVTPSAWSAGYKSIDFFGGSFAAATGGVQSIVSANAYNNGTNWIYKYSGNAAAMYIQSSSGGHAWHSAPSGTAGDPITFTQAMTLDDSGNLLVGTTSAASAVADGGVQVLVNGFATGQTTLDTGHITGTPTAIPYQRYMYAGTAVGSITQSGTTAVAYNTTSDHRLKENVRSANAARFNDIEFVDFEWVDGRHDCGVIAHQLQSVYPDLVIGEKDATEIRQVEIEPAIPAVTEQVLVTEAVLNDDGEEIEPAVYETVEVSPAVEAVMEDQEFPVYQQVNYIGLIGRMGTRIQIQDKLIQDLLARVEALEAK